jgi:hypothetical protein
MGVKALTIGSYPEITLAQARRARDEARIQLYNNIDPNAKRMNAYNK